MDTGHQLGQGRGGAWGAGAGQADALAGKERDTGCSGSVPPTPMVGAEGWG